MSAYDEAVAANAAVRALLANGAEARLRALPGVYHVSVGLKQTGGRTTSTLCIRVYVREKLPDDRLAPAARVPREIEGVPTDVNVVPGRLEFAAIDTTRYRPVVGGSLISNDIVVMKPDGTGTTKEAGTFGCTATRISDGSVVLLSNWHVLMTNGADIGDPIYQPTEITIPDFDAAELPKRVGKKDDIIAHNAGYAITQKVDAAIARLDVSSCCRCCGIDWKDEIVGLSDGGVPPGDNRLIGLRRVVSTLAVYKSGAVSGRTEGRILDDDFPEIEITRGGQTFKFSGQIAIANDDGLFRFSEHGDSGSMIVDAEGFVVGLLFASGNADPPEDITLANHIADVTSALGITINLDRRTTDTAGARVPVPTIRPSERDLAVYASARARLLADPAGEWLWAMAEAHRDEVIRLVTRHRPVTVAWHRAGGPALFARALETLRAGGDVLPEPAGDMLFAEAMARVGDALRAHGSPALRAAIDEHAPVLLAAVTGATTLGTVLETLREGMPART